MIIAPVVARLEKLFSSVPWFVNLYLKPYDEVLKREIDLAHINRNDIVLNIGCGGIPFSAIYIARKTGAKVYALDKDPQVTAGAQKCVRTLGLEQLITVIQGNGEDVDTWRKKIGQFSVGLVALQAAPKRAIIKQLLHYGKPGTRIIVRRPRPRLTGEYDALPVEVPIHGAVDQNMQTFDGSVLYMKAV